jgi:hypothetical protein
VIHHAIRNTTEREHRLIEVQVRVPIWVFGKGNYDCHESTLQHFSFEASKRSDLVREQNLY